MKKCGFISTGVGRNPSVRRAQHLIGPGIYLLVPETKIPAVEAREGKFIHHPSRACPLIIDLKKHPYLVLAQKIMATHDMPV